VHNQAAVESSLSEAAEQLEAARAEPKVDPAVVAELQALKEGAKAHSDEIGTLTETNAGLQSSNDQLLEEINDLTVIQRESV
jgi:hypothetical protein